MQLLDERIIYMGLAVVIYYAGKAALARWKERGATGEEGNEAKDCRQEIKEAPKNDHRIPVNGDVDNDVDWSDMDTGSVEISDSKSDYSNMDSGSGAESSSYDDGPNL